MLNVFLHKTRSRVCCHNAPKGTIQILLLNHSTKGKTKQKKGIHNSKVLSYNPDKIKKSQPLHHHTSLPLGEGGGQTGTGGTLIPFLSFPSFIYSFIHSSRIVESDFPDSRRHVRARADQPTLLGVRPVRQPRDGMHAADDRMLGGNVLQRTRDAPDVDVAVERARGAVSRVGRPRQRVDFGGVEGPAAGD